MLISLWDPKAPTSFSGCLRFHPWLLMASIVLLVMKSSARWVAQGGLSVSKTIMKIPFCRNCDPDMKPNPQQETSNFIGDKSQAHWKKLSLSWRMGIYHSGAKRSISLYTSVYLGMFFLGFILNQQNGFGSSLCLTCLDNGTTKMLSGFQHPRLLSWGLFWKCLFGFED